jgi:ubiquinone/menaquinone biosynthesis C-methylase UbiE
MERPPRPKESSVEETPKQDQHVPYNPSFDWNAAFSQDPGYLMSHPQMRDAFQVHQYLEGLGLSIAELKGKRLLNVGAGNGTFATALNQYGVEAIPLDIQLPDEPGERHGVPIQEVPNFVQGSAYDLPFEESSFDFVISNAGPLSNLGWAEEDSVRREEDSLTAQHPAIAEAIRVLKPEGEVRFEITLREQEADQDNAKTKLITMLENEPGITFSKEQIGEYDDGTQTSKIYRFVLRKKAAE